MRSSIAQRRLVPVCAEAHRTLAALLTSNADVGARLLESLTGQRLHQARTANARSKPNLAHGPRLIVVIDGDLSLTFACSGRAGSCPDYFDPA